MSRSSRRFRAAKAPQCLLALVVAGAVALSPAGAAAERPSDRPPPSCEEAGIAEQLGERPERRGVQVREFQKRGRVALAPRGGLFAGDLMSSSYTYGGELTVYATERLGLWSSVDVMPITLDLEEPLGTFFGDDAVGDDLGVLVLGGVSFSPIHAKLRMGSERIVHADLHLLAGAGRLVHDTSQGAAIAAGAALELFTTSWLTLRFDLRDVAALQGAAGQTALSHNIVATGGMSLWFPSAW